jgi:alanyl-tRNA synthetase
MITREKLIEKYLSFYESKDHKRIPSASLVPENDPTVLFTTAGMHPLVPFLLGQSHPLGKRLVNVQKCIRTGDIEEVGDATHHTFFEMLGNWSIGDYFKKEAIKYSFEFLTKTLKIPTEKLAVSCFEGNKDAKKDTEAEKVWLDLKIPKERVAFLDKKENWWETPGPGPCGPDTEIFYWASKKPTPKKFDPKNKAWVEIGNNVLMQYEKDKNNKYTEAKQKNIDFGGGVERLLAVLNNLEDNYETEIWKPLIKEIEKLSNKTYAPTHQSGSTSEDATRKAMRIIADHIKASIFIISDGIVPSNTEQGYVLRRLIRRAIRYGKTIGINQKDDLTTPLVKATIKIYKNTYPKLEKNKEKIINELNKEEEKFEKTLDKGLKILDKLEGKTISGKDAFLLYQSYGFPIEMTKELVNENKIKVDEKGFQTELKKHQELSQTAASGMFKSGLADNSEQTTKLHTATHLLLEALKTVLKNKNITQKGSNITPDRLRLDFNFDRKLTNEEKKEVENLVNKKIQEKIEITKEEMSPKEAKKKGATGIFDGKYPDIVSVYTIGAFSKEICTGPHVKNTSEIGKFKIKKEESSSSGVRRIKAVLE